MQAPILFQAIGNAKSKPILLTMGDDLIQLEEKLEGLPSNADKLKIMQKANKATNFLFIDLIPIKTNHYWGC